LTGPAGVIPQDTGG